MWHVPKRISCAHLPEVGPHSGLLYESLAQLINVHLIQLGFDSEAISIRGFTDINRGDKKEYEKPSRQY